MKSIKNIFVFIIIPIAIISLVIFNANYQAKIYSKQISGVDITQMKADYRINQKEYTVRKGDLITVPVEVTNEGNMTWLAHSEKPINLSYHIYNEEKEEYEYDGARTAISVTVRPKESAAINTKVQVPVEEGIYYVEFDMVYEGVAWFSEKGSKTESIKLEVR